MKQKYSLFLLVLFLVIVLRFSISSDKVDVNGIEDTISDIKSGNTIILSSGLTIHLNGIRRENAYTEELLKTFIGQEVTLKLDSTDEGTTVSSYEKEEVNCYVQLLKTGEDLSALLIKSGGVIAFERRHCHDRKKMYENMIETGSPTTSS